MERRGYPSKLEVTERGDLKFTKRGIHRARWQQPSGRSPFLNPRVRLPVHITLPPMEGRDALIEPIPTQNRRSLLAGPLKKRVHMHTLPPPAIPLCTHTLSTMSSKSACDGDSVGLVAWLPWSRR